MGSVPCSILIPAAGDSKRFVEKGYLGPKGLLMVLWNDVCAPMIYHVVPKAWEEWASPPRIVCKAEDKEKFELILPGNYDVHAIRSTRGQLDSCVQGMQGLQNDILVINSDNAFKSDSLLKDFVTSCRHKKAKCGAVVFHDTESEPGRSRYGYVDRAPDFSYGAEKQAISRWALAGAFYFESAHVLIEAFERMQQAYQPYTVGEYYLSKAFAFISDPKLAWPIMRDSLHEWGTPELMALDPTALLLPPEDSKL